MALKIVVGTHNIYPRFYTSTIVHFLSYSGYKISKTSLSGNFIIFKDREDVKIPYLEMSSDIAAFSHIETQCVQLTKV